MPFRPNRATDQQQIDTPADEPTRAPADRYTLPDTFHSQRHSHDRECSPGVPHAGTPARQLRPQDCGSQELGFNRGEPWRFTVCRTSQQSKVATDIATCPIRGPGYRSRDRVKSDDGRTRSTSRPRVWLYPTIVGRDRVSRKGEAKSERRSGDKTSRPRTTEVGCGCEQDWRKLTVDRRGAGAEKSQSSVFGVVN